MHRWLCRSSLGGNCECFHVQISCMHHQVGYSPKMQLLEDAMISPYCDGGLIAVCDFGFDNPKLFEYNSKTRDDFESFRSLGLCED